MKKISIFLMLIFCLNLTTNIFSMKEKDSSEEVALYTDSEEEFVEVIIPSQENYTDSEEEFVEVVIPKKKLSKIKSTPQKKWGAHLIRRRLDPDFFDEGTKSVKKDMPLECKGLIFKETSNGRYKEIEEVTPIWNIFNLTGPSGIRYLEGFKCVVVKRKKK